MGNGSIVEPTATILDSGTRVNDTLSHSHATDPLSILPHMRKNALYAILCISVSTHALGACCLVTSIQIIANDLHLGNDGNAIWLVSATAMAFAACIPLGGRLADVFPPQWCFAVGSLGMTSFALGNSFVHGKELFLAFRALQGVCAALTLPSGFAMIVRMYPDRLQQRTRLIAVSVVISLAMACGYIVGGLLALANWRWIFRFLACVIFICVVSGWALLPSVRNPTFPNKACTTSSCRELIKKLDLIGIGLLMSALLLFNLGLTSTSVYGWKDAHFLAPFLISTLLLPTFCVWELKRDVRYAMLPVAIMKQPKFLVVCFTGLVAEMWFSTSQVGPSRFFQEVLHDRSLIVGAKLCPQFVGATIGGLLHTFYISKHIRPKYTLLVGMLLTIAPGTILIIVSGGGRGEDYYKYLIPAFLIGSFFIVIVWDAASVLVIQAVPSGYSGIASSVFMMFVQTGIVIGTPIQAAFYTAAGVFIWLPASKPNSEEPPEVLVEATEREASASLVQEKGVEARKPESNV